MAQTGFTTSISGMHVEYESSFSSKMLLTGLSAPIEHTFRIRNNPLHASSAGLVFSQTVPSELVITEDGVIPTPNMINMEKRVLSWNFGHLNSSQYTNPIQIRYTTYIPFRDAWEISETRCDGDIIEHGRKFFTVYNASTEYTYQTTDITKDEETGEIGKQERNIVVNALDSKSTPFTAAHTIVSVGAAYTGSYQLPELHVTDTMNQTTSLQMFFYLKNIA